MRMLPMALGAAIVLVTAAPSGRSAGASAPTATRSPADPSIMVRAPVEPDRDSGAEMVGRPAPDWSFDRWIRTRPLSLERLRGKVVLLRFWTEGCHYCRTTLPVLERLRKREGDRLVVIGAFHPKPPHEVSDRHILEVANRIGFSGPIAVDAEWSTLERYWLAEHPERDWTSVSFLIDRQGIIRWVHGGGEYHPSDDPRHAACADDYRGLERALQAALAAPAP